MALDLTMPENQEELAKLIQSETDKVRTKYSTEMKKLQEQLTQLQLQSMNSTQKAEFELKQKTDELAKKEAELNKKMLDLDTKELVSSKGLKPELAILLTADTIEGRKAQLEVLVKTMNLEVKEEIIKKVGQDDPQQSNEYKGYGTTMGGGVVPNQKLLVSEKHRSKVKGVIYRESEHNFKISKMYSV